MSIPDIILFVSSTSQACISLVQFIQKIKAPVRIVRLDTVRDRQLTSQGRYFQIHTVPTLLLAHHDGNIQLFVGQEKIMAWFHSVSQPNTPRNEPHPLPKEEYSSEEEEPPKKPKKKKKSSISRKKPPSKKGLYDGTSKRKKKPPVRFVESDTDSDEEVEIEFVDNPPLPQTPRPNRPVPPPTSGLMVGPHSEQGSKKRSQMTGLMDIAKQMEKERQSTLGYREEDLPK